MQQTRSAIRTTYKPSELMFSHPTSRNYIAWLFSFRPASSWPQRTPRSGLHQHSHLDSVRGCPRAESEAGPPTYKLQQLRDSIYPDPPDCGIGASSGYRQYAHIKKALHHAIGLGRAWPGQTMLYAQRLAQSAKLMIAAGLPVPAGKQPISELLAVVAALKLRFR